MEQKQNEADASLVFDENVSEVSERFEGEGQGFSAADAAVREKMGLSAEEVVPAQRRKTYLQLLKKQEARAKREAASVVPVSETAAPISETTEPIVDTVTPVAETTAPISETVPAAAEPVVPAEEAAPGPVFEPGPASDDVHEVLESNFEYGVVGQEEDVPIDDLVGGVRLSDPGEQVRVRELAEEIQENGRFDRIIVDDAGEVLEGQHRLEAARELGMTSVPVQRVVDLARGYPTIDMREAAMKAGKLYPEQARQIVEQSLEKIQEEGSIEVARNEYDYGEHRAAFLRRIRRGG